MSGGGNKPVNWHRAEALRQMGHTWRRVGALLAAEEGRPISYKAETMSRAVNANRNASA